MSDVYKDQQQPWLARESLFRQKLNQLRTTGEIQRQASQSNALCFRQIEHSQYLTNVCSDLASKDPANMENLALLDSLTELYNHNALCRLLSDEVRRAQRYQREIALLAIAADGLSQDGSPATPFFVDALLKELAQFLMKAVRDVDVLGRYDFEHFMIVCPETNLDGALSLAGRLCLEIEKQHFAAKRTKAPLTISLGITAFPNLANNGEQLLHSSLQALNLAQQAGGNTFKVGSVI